MLILRLIFILCLSSLSACSLFSAKAEYIPDNEVLKNATVGEPYFYKIDILGGGVIGIIGMERNVGLVVPDDAGIFLRNCQLPAWRVKNMKPMDSNNYNCVEIYGTPTKPGIIKINISGGMYGNMFVPASEFSKDYTLKINQP